MMLLFGGLWSIATNGSSVAEVGDFSTKAH